MNLTNDAKGLLTNWISISCAVYIAFITSIYVGLLGSLHYFWYPDLKLITNQNLQEMFILPLSHALSFFQIAVPVMLLMAGLLTLVQWKTELRWIAVWMLVLIIVQTLVSVIFLLPINTQIIENWNRKNDFSLILLEWMKINDIRLLLSIAIWLLCLVFFYSKKSSRYL